MQVYNISDGVRLCCVDTGSKFKTNMISVSMLMPLDENTSARALLPFVLKSRCALYPDRKDFSKKLDELYGAHISGSVTKSGDLHLLYLSFNGIDDRFSLDGESVSCSGLELLMEVLFNPVAENGCFPDEIINEEKRVLIERIENENNDKRRYAARKCEEKMYEGEAFAKSPLGKKDEVLKLNGSDVYRAWRDLLSGAAVQITAVGGISDGTVLNVIKKYFNTVERCPVELKTVVKNEVDDVKYFSEEQPIKQGKLVMGLRTGMKDLLKPDYAMRVAVDIFGGGTYSKLFSVVREKMSLCYYCSAGLNSLKGTVTVQSGIENANEEKAKTEILNQLSLVANGDFSDEVLESSRKAISDGAISSNDTPFTLEMWYFGQCMYPDLLSPEEYAENISKVDRSAVIEAAKTIKPDTVFMLRSSEEAENDEN